MTCIHNNEVNNIAECNLLHGIINPPKRAKSLKIHYSPILHGCINIRKVKVNFKNFRVLLDSWCISTIVMGSLVKTLAPEKDSPVQWHMQAGNITPNLKVKVYFTLLVLSATNVVTWKYNVDESAKGRYDIILGQYLLT